MKIERMENGWLVTEETSGRLRFVRRPISGMGECRILQQEWAGFKRQIGAEWAYFGGRLVPEHFREWRDVPTEVEDE